MLGELTAAARIRSHSDTASLAALRRSALARLAANPPASLAAALRRDDVAVIAEAARRSPYAGVIDDAMDVGGVATAAATGGAAALSILTEPSAFGGALADLEMVSRRVRIPLIRKDFVVSTSQVFEAAAAGAAAVVLVARAVGPEAVFTLADAAHGIGLEAFVEVRSEAELGWAIGAEADVICVGAYDLETLDADPVAALQLLARVPGGVPVVYGGAVEHRVDVERAAAAGADAVLVGLGLSAVGRWTEAVRALAGVPRRPRTV